MSTATKTLWNIDADHSGIQFKVKHLVISTVTGSFKKFEARAESEGDHFDGAKVRFEAETASIDTGNGQRDEHLKSEDFFNAAEYPGVVFESTSFKKTGENRYEMTGDLTIRDITRPVTLDVVHGGTVEDPYGQTKAGFEVTGTINRKEFGLKWNGVTEAGTLVVGDEVQLIMNVQFIKDPS